MNAGPADTRSPHLDLGDLIAQVTGRAIDDQAREHLGRCEHCRAEAKRWDLVAGGVRGLVAATPEQVQPARPRHTRLRVPAGPWRRAMLVAGSAAAALLLLVGIGEVTGYVHVHLSGPPTQAAVTAVGGCVGLKQADGTLEQVNGSSLIIKTAGGQAVTVTTTASTFVGLSGPLLSDITDGASVMVRGSSSGGTIAAVIVTVGPPFSAVNPPGFVPVKGTVSDASSAGFTIVTSSGTRIPVTTSGNTLVVVPHASLSQLQVGGTISAVGQAGPHGTLSARAVSQASQLPSGARTHTGVRVRTCSPAAIAAALVSGG